MDKLKNILDGKATRWGIASAGLISNDFTNSIVGVLPPEEHLVVAVAARKIEDAEAFAAKHNIEKAYGDYQELANDENIDVIYIGSINIAHLSLAKMYLEAGKSVLCEKPLCVNVKETEELVNLARSKKVFLMEAVWSRCLPSYKALMKAIDDGEVGEVKQVLCGFGFPIVTERVNKKEMGGGAILDLGIYTIQLAQLVFGGEMPTVTAAGHLNPDGCDESASITLTYSNGRTASLTTSCKVQLPNEAIVVGTKGTIKLINFWTSIELIHADGRSEKFDLPSGSRNSFNFFNSANFAHEAAHVRQCLMKGAPESDLLSLTETLTIANIMEQARKQIGVHYPQDD